MDEKNQNLQVEPAAEQTPVPQPEAVQPAQGSAAPAPAKKNMLPIIIGAAAAVLLLVIIIAVAVTVAGGSPAEPPHATYAMISGEGNAYFPQPNGKVIEIKDVSRAVMTPDQKHIAVVESDGRIYVTDKNLKKKEVITNEAIGLVATENEGLIYADDDGYVRVFFKDMKKLRNDEVRNITVAQNTLSMIFLTEDMDLYLLPANAEKPEKLDTFASAGDVAGIGVSNKGKIAAWLDGGSESDANLIMAYENGKKVKIGEIDRGTSTPIVMFSADEKMYIFISSGSDRAWLKKVGKDPVEVKLGAAVADFNAYTKNDAFTDVKASAVKGLYMATHNEDYKNLYYITMNGDRERTLSKLQKYHIADGRIIYIDDDSNLCTANLDKANVSDEKIIFSNVKTFQLAGERYLYYIVPNYSGDNANELHCYDLSKDKDYIVSNKASMQYGYMAGACFTEKGDTVYFMTDLENIGNGLDYGMLMKWSVGKKEAEKIASEVILYSLTSGKGFYTVEKNRFFFEKYDYMEDGRVFSNLMFYKGKEAEKVASDILADR